MFGKPKHNIANRKIQQTKNTKNIASTRYICSILIELNECILTGIRSHWSAPPWISLQFVKLSYAKKVVAKPAGHVLLCRHCSAAGCTGASRRPPATQRPAPTEDAATAPDAAAAEDTLPPSSSSSAPISSGNVGDADKMKVWRERVEATKETGGLVAWWLVPWWVGTDWGGRR